MYFTGPFKDFPQVTVYHPSDPKYGHAFANIGWTGWFGSITGNVNVNANFKKNTYEVPRRTVISEYYHYEYRILV